MTRRIPGTAWRILAHPTGKGPTIDLESKDYPRSDRVEHYGPGSLRILDYRTIFDELVLDHWLHLEQMNTRDWWMRIGPYMVNVRVGNDGEAVQVRWELDEDGGTERQRDGATEWTRTKKERGPTPADPGSA